MTENEMVGWHHRFKDMKLGKLQEMEAWPAAVHEAAESDTTWGLNNSKSFFENFKFCPHNSTKSVLTEVMKSM